MKAQIYTTLPEAVFPQKANPTDIGFDLTIVKHIKKLTSNTSLYDTGIKVIPPEGYYTEIVGRSSISKSGYMLANNIGIIDPSYTGNLLVALTKTDQQSEDLVLPYKCCQMIFRKHNNHIGLEQIDSFDKITNRGEGGFGSSDT